MPQKRCPDNYLQHSNSCFNFGTHSSFKDALRICKAKDARLADITSRNIDFIKDNVSKFGGSDFWIGSYVLRGKVVKKQNVNCPVLKGRNTGIGSYNLENCNSAYPYICQKYGGTQVESGNFPGSLSFNRPFVDPDSELELPVTETFKTKITTTIKPSTAPNQTIPAVVSVVGIILVAIVIIYLCKRRARNRRKKIRMKFNELEKEPTENHVTNLSRRPSINKPHHLPLTSSITTINSERHTVRHPSYRENPWDYRENLCGISSAKVDVDPGYERRDFSSLQDIQLRGAEETPPPPYNMYPLRPGSQQDGRRSRRGSFPDLTVTGCSNYSDQAFFDASISRTAYDRRSQRRHDELRHFHGSESPPPRDYERTPSMRRDYRRESFRHQPFRDARMPPYEGYDAGASSALDTMSRRSVGSNLRDHDPFFGRSRSFRGRNAHYDVDLMHPPPSNPLVLGRANNAFIRDDLRSTSDYNSGSDAIPASMQVRPLRRSPIGKHRNIKQEDPGLPPRSTSQESDHIYESLDDMKVDTHQQVQEMSSRHVTSQGTGGFSRDVTRVSGRSRVSMRDRNFS